MALPSRWRRPQTKECRRLSELKMSPVDQSPHPHRSKLYPQAEPGSRFSLRDSRLQAK